MSCRFPARIVRAVAVGGALMVIVPTTALAHLGLSRAVPADGAHVAEAPRALKLTFTEAVDVALARLRLIGPSGAEVPISPLRRQADSAQIILADVRGALEAGIYKLEWQVVGTDGHPVRGTISYVVAPGASGLDDPDRIIPPAGGEPRASVPKSDHEGTAHDPVSIPRGENFDSESFGYVAIRAVQFTALLVVIGALAFAFVVLGLLDRKAATDPAVLASMRMRAAHIGFLAALTVLATAVGRLYAQSLAMHGPGDSLELDYVITMVAKTVWGAGWLLQIAGSVIALVGFAMARRGRAGGWAAAAAGGLMLAITPALSGHAAATPGRAALAVTADALHVIGAAGWLGSLLFVLLVGIPMSMAHGVDNRAAGVARIVNAFSPTALIFAGLTVFTGLLATWLHVGISSALWTSDYGRTLLIKLAILAIVLATGAYNWLRVKPALGDATGARRMQRSATVELAVGLLVVIVTAVLVATPPPLE